MVNFDDSIACTHYGKKWLELAQLFRSLSLKVLDDRNTVLSHLDAPLFDQLYMDRSSSCLERTKMYEVLAYGDPNVLLSCPGPSLSGIIVRELGSTEQQDYFLNMWLSIKLVPVWQSQSQAKALMQEIRLHC
ncbi:MULTISPECIES: hypothetical protein [Photorhabdus]|uniref:Uncharacterized protein n=1 Tax=Photorhabdus luminescens TaxID=29488 RepID=A0A1G5QIR8_PHOLU|nr:hypothetical protein [Photorhabdus luminescens]SCZ61518.1 hypothetical protein SAMN02982990_01728 [Photorhabdus luminescens]